jgi:excisionase family DNA binding protein
MNDELLTIKEVAQRLRMSVHTVGLWCRDEKIRHYKIGDLKHSPVRIPASEVERILKEAERGPVGDDHDLILS